MASPLPTGKQPVKLSSSAHAGSRIRRDPPPAVKAIVVHDPEERDQRAVIIGILTFTLALIVILVAVTNYSGWTPRDYTVEV